MNQPFFVTVGTTALTNEGIGSADGSPNSILQDRVNSFLGDPVKPALGYGAHRRLAEELIRSHVIAWQTPGRFEDRKRYRTTSAELLSTYLATRAPGFELDGIVLLCSETEEGRFAAEINRDVMRTSEYRRALRPDLDFLEVQVAVIYGLDANTADFTEVTRETVKAWLPAAKDVKVRVNITGGYKSLAATFGIVAVLDSRYRLFYMHESTEVLMCINPENRTGGPAKTYGDA